MLYQLGFSSLLSENAKRPSELHPVISRVFTSRFLRDSVGSFEIFRKAKLGY